MRILRGVWQVMCFAWEFTAVIVSLMRMPKEPRRERRDELPLGNVRAACGHVTAETRAGLTPMRCLMCSGREER